MSVFFLSHNAKAKVNTMWTEDKLATWAILHLTHWLPCHQTRLTHNTSLFSLTQHLVFFNRRFGFPHRTTGHRPGCTLDRSFYLFSQQNVSWQFQKIFQFSTTELSATVFITFVNSQNNYYRECCYLNLYCGAPWQLLCEITIVFLRRLQTMLWLPLYSLY